jgi:hypothetical protein
MGNQLSPTFDLSGVDIVHYGAKPNGKFTRIVFYLLG